MPKRVKCVIADCKTGEIDVPVKRACFKVPEDIEKRKKWEESIPKLKRGMNLRMSHVICERHFRPELVVKNFRHYDTDGHLIQDVPLKRPHLVKGAIPTIFTPDEEMPHTESCNEDSHSGEEFQRSDNEAVSYFSDHKNFLQEQNFPCQMDEGKDDIVTSTGWDHQYRKLCEDLSLSNVTHDRSSISNYPERENATLNDLTVYDSRREEDFSTTSTNYSKLHVIKNSCIGDGNSSIDVPLTWSISQATGTLKSEIIFAHVRSFIDDDMRKFVVNKYIVIETQSREIQYYIHGKLVDLDPSQWPRYLFTLADLPTVLSKFERMRICQGLSSLKHAEFVHNDGFRDTAMVWHSNECSLLTKRRVCNECRNFYKTVWQRRKRLNEASEPKRIRDVSDPADKIKLQRLRKKLRRKNRRAKRAKLRIELLNKELKQRSEKIAALESESVIQKCKRYNIPENQILLVQEIISAAQANPKGRRYEANWLMLCMLMNIRSPSLYRSLRENDIMPLPCPRTVRHYFSNIDSKCGFDAKFAHLLTKSFTQLESKNWIERHGVLLIDEIHLRKSMNVCSSDLTYTGLIDFGEDGPSARDIHDQATKGLVLMFQPLAGHFTQPIAVFASKNSVSGDELAKLTIKAITYLEQCGAKIHGVVSDGASTNKRMQYLLHVRSELHDTKTWFRHPFDDNRRVFIFSDVPHLLKNIRNRLYNKKRLRLKGDDNYVEWKYFEYLFEEDTRHMNNLRVCPKVSKRHIELDQASKMRVRLAAQIFSDSVAKGLRYYKGKSMKFIGCEETIEFCQKVNDMFDALNRRLPTHQLTPDSRDFKTLESSLKWLNDWENAMIDGEISRDEYLTIETSEGLRLSLQSTMDLCRDLIDNYNFKYFLTGKVNQDNLERFFGTVRQAAGANEHPDCSTFLKIYKILSVYSIIKPPKYGNCSVTDKKPPRILISLDELKDIYGKKRSKYCESREKLKSKLDQIISREEWEADDVIESEHDYFAAPVVDCIVYFVTGYLCKQILKSYGASCSTCHKALVQSEQDFTPLTQLVDLKSRGRLIHSNRNFFNLIRFVEDCFQKHATSPYAYDETLEEVVSTYSDFSFPCAEHASDVLSYAICYYIRLRMRQFCYQENQKLKKNFVVRRKLSKITTDS